MSEILRDDETREIFPVFDIQWKQERQNELFALLQDEITHNPDIQSLWVEIFWFEDEFFAWYLSPTNRWIENGIPDWISKIDALKELQQLYGLVVDKGISEFGNKKDFYRQILRYNIYNKFCHNQKTIPLFFPENILKQYIEEFNQWPNW